MLAEICCHPLDRRVMIKLAEYGVMVVSNIGTDFSIDQTKGTDIATIIVSLKTESVNHF